MKKGSLLAIALSLCVFLTACGAKEGGESSESIWRGLAPDADLEAYTERTDYYDFIVEEESFDVGLWEKNPQDQLRFSIIARGGTVYTFLGAQFWKGEPVQLWAETSLNGGKVFLYRKDGSSEILLENAPGQYAAYDTKYVWYIDREGDFYCYVTVYVDIDRENRAQGTLVKMLSSGEVLYEKKLEAGVIINDLCQTDDGHVYIQLQEQGKETRLLAEVDPATGEVLPDSRTEIPLTFMVYLGTAEGFPAVTGYTMDEPSHKIMKVEKAGGSLSPAMYFTGTSYGWPDGMRLQDFRMLEDGQIEFLWTDYYGHSSLWQKLRMEKLEKTPIVLRGIFYSDTWLANQAVRFNRENDTYHVIIEDCADRNGVKDFARLTGVQVGAGKGPDILCGSSLLSDSINGMLEKGVLEELNPYMEASGVREEDYFPLTFSSWRQGESIYAVNPRVSVRDYQIDEAVLGSRETPDIETLTDALLSWEGDSLYQRGYSSRSVLRTFLEGTENLWGMVDWENGSCDFDTPLFGKLLETAKRYGDDGRKGLQSPVMYSQYFTNITHFKGREEQEEEKKVTCGFLFDDGCHAAAASTYAMAINANSAHKEGAWEFIRFLIGEEAQSDTSKSTPPVHRDVFETWMQEIIDTLVKEHYVNGILIHPSGSGIDASEKKQEEYRKAIEDARPLPIRTEPVLAIVLQEAEDYFNGGKSAEEVSKVINNRVRLYLEEMK